ncbi:hypothetical protein [Roseomonas xinghualingensis]|uniref:hypothetical protein n=1 Tax=Roseomonas xinghualingensis TaxID=2986475 RepID=UPI0021F1653A|nr:hypothetical protein [Roseomonas sp. SXEYE001]
MVPVHRLVAAAATTALVTRTTSAATMAAAMPSLTEVPAAAHTLHVHLGLVRTSMLAPPACAKVRHCPVPGIPAGEMMIVVP